MRQGRDWSPPSQRSGRSPGCPGLMDSSTSFLPLIIIYQASFYLEMYKGANYSYSNKKKALSRRGRST